MSDCENVEDDSPIRQGDIFLHSTWAKQDSWDRLGVVLTADCDIANRKFGAHLAYLSILALPDYIDEVVVPNALQRCIERACREVRQLIEKGRKAPTARALSQSAIEAWIRNGDITDLEGQVCLSHKEMQRLVDIQNVARKSITTESCDFNARRELLMNLQGTLQKKKESERKEMLRNDIRNALARPSQDVFFVTDIPSLPIGINHGFGFFVQLRAIRFIDPAAIADKLSGATEGDATVIRVARLLPTFKYALVQQFSHLYSRIGLPSAWEEEQQSIVDFACGELQI